MKKTSFSFATGAVALVFAVIGYETALLVHYGAVARITANRDHPDTVYVYPQTSGPVTSGGGERNAGAYAGRMVRHNSVHSPVARKYREKEPPPSVETFRFNPNTASVEELRRLGFSVRQAAAIDAYRSKGGRYRRPSDFARSFVVSDSVYARLKDYIDIPLLDLNKADSSDFDALPGIGGYFAARMVQYRKRLGGYSCPEQLLEINRFDSARFEALRDLVTVSSPPVLHLWTAPADTLLKHPYIRSGSVARSIVFYREHNSVSDWTLKGLADAGVIDRWQFARLKRCVIETIPSE